MTMNHILIAALAGTALTIAAAQIQPQYATGELHATTFSIETSSTLVEFKSLMDGVEGAGMPEMERETNTKLEGTFHDLISRTNDHQLVAFDREYLEIAETFSNHIDDPRMGQVDDGSDKISALDELTVHFERGDGGFEAQFPKDSGEDEQLLEGLTGALAFAALLPEGSVEIDDEWEVPAEAIWSFFEPGGDLSLEESAERSEMPEGLIQIDAAGVPSEIEGDCAASLSAVREINGARHAVLSLSLEFTRFQDLTEIVRASTGEAPEDLPEGAVVPEIDSMESETFFEGTGTLLWNLETGAASSLEVNLSSERTETTLMKLSMGTEDLEIEQIMIYEGETAILYEVEVTRE